MGVRPKLYLTIFDVCNVNILEEVGSAVCVRPPVKSDVGRMKKKLAEGMDLLLGLFLRMLTV